MGLVSCRRDREQNIYSDIDVKKLSVCVCSQQIFLTSMWPKFSKTSNRAAANPANRAPPNTLYFPGAILLCTIHGLNSCLCKRLIVSFCYCGSYKNMCESALHPRLTCVCCCVTVCVCVWPAVQFSRESGNSLSEVNVSGSECVSAVRAVPACVHNFSRSELVKCPISSRAWKHINYRMASALHVASHINLNLLWISFSTLYGSTDESRCFGM